MTTSMSYRWYRKMAIPIAMGTRATAPLLRAFWRLLAASLPGPMICSIGVVASTAATMRPPA
jgi:hypothetical protein